MRTSAGPAGPRSWRIRSTLRQGRPRRGAHGPAKDGFFKLSLGSVGVVFGDIGTSPLYALRESLSHVAHDGQFTRAEVIGIVSLLIWAIVIIVTIKIRRLSHARRQQG